MDLQGIIERWPYLASPAALMQDENPTFQLPPHLKFMNEMAMGVTERVARGGAGVRKIINLPFGHAKSVHWSHYWPAWTLLLYPDTRFIIVGHGDEFASKWGGKIRDTLQKYGRDHGVSLRRDRKAQGSWQIEGHKGGVTCMGPTSGTVGHHCEIYLIDDLLAGYQDALSPTILDNRWAFFETSVISRLRDETSLVMVGTRWVKNDPFGRVIARYRGTAEWPRWEIYKLKALAEKDDPLGRAPGEPLWPRQFSKEQLEVERSKNRWWKAAWQQEPAEEMGSFFQPSRWPRYHDIGGTFSLGVGRRFVPKDQLIHLVTVDWAASDKKTSDFTCIGVFGITPWGDILVLEVVFERVKVEKCVPLLASVCRRWHPSAVAVEVGGFQSALAVQCRDFPEIPGEVIQLKPESKNKLARALPAHTMGDAGRIFLPREEKAGDYLAGGNYPWMEEFCLQLTEFDGITESEKDDAVDVLAYGARRAQWLYRGVQVAQPPCMLTAPREGF